MFQNHKQYYWYVYNNNVKGNVTTIHKSCGKGFYYCAYYTQVDGGSSNITGNINIWSDKYDLEHLAPMNVHVSGQFSVLKNLQKLTYVNFHGNGSGSVTGSKSDFYNGGANITEWFYRDW